METKQFDESLEKFKSLERSFRTALPENSYAVIRVDGKGFSKYTSKMVKPFDPDFTKNMQETAKYLCENVDGALFAYTQSDEISVIISDLQSEKAQWWHGGQVQKIISVTAAYTTAKFNSLGTVDNQLPVFDGRVHSLDTLDDVLGYLQWRQADALKNSVGMLASHHFSHKFLDGVGTSKRRDHLIDIGHPWEELPQEVKQGTFVSRYKSVEDIEYFHKKEKVMKSLTVERQRWSTKPAPLFTMEHLV